MATWSRYTTWKNYRRPTTPREGSRAKGHVADTHYYQKDERKASWSRTSCYSGRRSFGSGRSRSGGRTGACYSASSSRSGGRGGCGCSAGAARGRRRTRSWGWSRKKCGKRNARAPNTSKKAQQSRTPACAPAQSGATTASATTTTTTKTVGASTARSIAGRAECSRR